MPKQVDHHDRRQRIAEAVWRIAADRGLEAASMSAVAVEAGVSIGLIQHYFDSKDQLVVFAAAQLRERIDRRVQDQLAAAPEPRTPMTLLRATLTALLPLTSEDRTVALAGVAVFIRALHEPTLTTQYRRGHTQLAAALAGQIAAAARAGELRADLDPGIEASILAALVSGLASDLLLGACPPARAAAMIERHLEHLR
ncbi:TetR/AcrR family transcriptional regulator [Micromonospora sp. NPDC006431]|uniref:TetR/AcrR family transcriptional regulator n=1 Tax=Micromonospora sp. NPDC006431 TaxID=3364235 RepID=UPI0036960EAC